MNKAEIMDPMQEVLFRRWIWRIRSSEAFVTPTMTLNAGSKGKAMQEREL